MPARHRRRSSSPHRSTVRRPSLVSLGLDENQQTLRGAPGKIRTSDPWFRRPVLYPAELRAHPSPRKRGENGGNILGPSYVSTTTSRKVALSALRHLERERRKTRANYEKSAGPGLHDDLTTTPDRHRMRCETFQHAGMMQDPKMACLLLNDLRYPVRQGTTLSLRTYASRLALWSCTGRHSDDARDLLGCTARTVSNECVPGSPFRNGSENEPGFTFPSYFPRFLFFLVGLVELVRGASAVNPGTAPRRFLWGSFLSPCVKLTRWRAHS